MCDAEQDNIMRYLLFYNHMTCRFCDFFDLEANHQLNVNVSLLSINSCRCNTIILSFPSFAWSQMQWGDSMKSSVQEVIGIMNAKPKIWICFYHFVTTAIELMARLQNITGLTPVSRSVTTGKKWPSGDDMAVDVTQNRDQYLGG